MKLNKFLAIPIFISIQLSSMDEPFQCKVSKLRAEQAQEKQKDDEAESTTSKVKRFAFAGIKDIALAYSIWWINLLSHEFGHAIAAKLLVNPKEMNIFAGPADKPALFSIGNLHITSLFPRQGSCSNMTVPLWKGIIILAAGPIVGTATACYCYKKIKNKYPDGGYSLSKLCALFWIGANPFSLYPMGNNDGAQIKNGYQLCKKYQQALQGSIA